jgi:hypothetical protein
MFDKKAKANNDNNNSNIGNNNSNIGNNNSNRNRLV